MQSPPFRADQVGSLLRPASLADARASHRAGAIDAASLQAAEDAAITEAVRRQRACGLQSITDGEFRRDWWHLDFLAQLDGVTLVDNGGQKFRIAGQSEQPPIASVTGRVGCSGPIMADHFRFLAEFAREPDAFLGTLGFGLTMGQWLSLPMAAVGGAMVVVAMRRPPETEPAAPAAS